MGIGQVQGRQRNSRDCYDKLLELAEMEPELPQEMEVKKTSRGLMETNIDPRLQEDESTTGPMEELIEIQVGPKGEASAPEAKSARRKLLQG